MPALAIDHVERAGDPVDPHAPVEERVGEVEEVAPAGLVRAVREPVHEERHDGDADAHDGREATEVGAGAGGHGVESSPSASGVPAGFGTDRSRLYPRSASSRPIVIRMNGRQPTMSDQLIG